ncbi:hypothetical protein EDB19DRAFT_1917989 [Suillus lakei]|nr:hypothetical protein EDB19DRAFT_1917989 [Suillus lakei]
MHQNWDPSFERGTAPHTFHWYEANLMMQTLESCTWRTLLWLLASECGSWRQDHLGPSRRNNSPAITAYRIENSKRVYLDRTRCPEDEFQRIIIKQVGHAVLSGTLPSGGAEEYLIPFLDRLWYLSPYIKLAETSDIQSSIGWLSTIEYKGKGYSSGSHSFKAMLTSPAHFHTSPHAIERTLTYHI